MFGFIRKNKERIHELEQELERKQDLIIELNDKFSKQGCLVINCADDLFQANKKIGELEADLRKAKATVFRNEELLKNANKYKIALQAVHTALVKHPDRLEIPLEYDENEGENTGGTIYTGICQLGGCSTNPIEMKSEMEAYIFSLAFLALHEVHSGPCASCYEEYLENCT